MAFQSNDDAEPGVGMNLGSGIGGGKLPPYPGDSVTASDKERWLRTALRQMSSADKAIIRGAVPAELKAKTETVAESSIPPLPATPSESVKATRTGRDM